MPRYPPIGARRLRAGFDDEVERGPRDAAEAGEAGVVATSEPNDVIGEPLSVRVA
jgi:hypothetical protein